MRRLPGPAVWRLSEGDQTPEALYELFRDWQRTQTQSSVRTLRSLRQQMDVRSCGMQGPPAERQLLRVRKTLIDKGLRLATIGVKAAGVCCTCASAPLSKASLRLRCSTPGSCACCQLRKTRRDSGRSLSAPKEISCLPLDKDLHGRRQSAALGSPPKRSANVRAINVE